MKPLLDNKRPSIKAMLAASTSLVIAMALAPSAAQAGLLGFKAEGDGSQAVGVWGEGNGDSAAGMHAHAVGSNAVGVFAYGSKYGVKGYADSDSVPGSIGLLGYGETGVDAYGKKTGMHVVTGASGTAILAEGGTYGLFATGNWAKNSWGSGVIARGDVGVVARGTTMGLDSTADGIAVAGISGHDVGGMFGGAKAPIRLLPAVTKGAPTAASGGHYMGEMFIDSVGTLYLCMANGTPGTWKKVVLQ